MVTLPLPRHGLQESEIVVIRALSPNNAYALKCSFHRICRSPFAYIHLSFPRNIHGAVVRKSVRRQGGARRGRDAHAALIENLSATGPLLCATEAIAEKQQTIRLSFA